MLRLLNRPKPSVLHLLEPDVGILSESESFYT